MSTENNTEEENMEPQSNMGENFMKQMGEAMAAAMNRVSKHTICVDVYAPTKEQAHAAVGMMLRTDATMFTLDAVPYTAGCRVDWESLRLQGVPQPDGNAMLWPLLAMMMAMPSK